jgi:hypothetical protein
MVYRDFVDISVAVATPSGLVVPVIRNCQDLGFADIEKVSYLVIGDWSFNNHIIYRKYKT